MGDSLRYRVKVALKNISNRLSSYLRVNVTSNKNILPLNCLFKVRQMYSIAFITTSDCRRHDSFQMETHATLGTYDNETTTDKDKADEETIFKNVADCREQDVPMLAGFFLCGVTFHKYVAEMWKQRALEANGDPTNYDKSFALMKEMQDESDAKKAHEASV